MFEAKTLTVMEKLELKAHEAWESGNLKLAFELFSKGATKGLADCMHDLGYFYDMGIGTAIDKQKAMYWYKRAYRHNCSAAANNIAVLYREKGRFSYSFQWFQRASLLNDSDAEVELAKLCIAGKGVRRSIAKAKSHLKKALASDNITPAGMEEAKRLMAQV